MSFSVMTSHCSYDHVWFWAFLWKWNSIPFCSDGACALRMNIRSCYTAHAYYINNNIKICLINWILQCNWIIIMECNCKSKIQCMPQHTLWFGFAKYHITIFSNFTIGTMQCKSTCSYYKVVTGSAQCKRVHIFIAQFAIFRVFQEVNGSWQLTASSSFLTISSFIYSTRRNDRPRVLTRAHASN